MNNQTRIGFVLFPIHLLGMHNYLRNLFTSLQSLPGQPLVPVVFGGREQIAKFQDCKGLELVTASMLERRSPAWWLRRAIQKLTGKDLLLERLLRRHGISLLSHSSHLGAGARLPVVGWIADLQHVHLPQMFSPAEVQLRNHNFGELADRSDAVILGSEYGLQDFAAFSPRNAHKGRVLHFIASPLAAAKGEPHSALENRYGFTGPYFVLPNHFWQHKNHRVVIDALAILRQRCQAFTVLATGSTENTSYPDFFPQLMQHANDCGVADLFHALGVIPFQDLVGLLQGAVAILNPSLFEGWSTSVEEAKTMGKQVVLSSIPVHLEQAPRRAYYFSPDNPSELADALSAAAAAYDPALDAREQAQAQQQYPARLQAFGEAYRKIVEDVLNAGTNA